MFVELYAAELPEIFPIWRTNFYQFVLNYAHFERKIVQILHISAISCSFWKLWNQCDQTFSSEPARTILKPAQLASPQFLVLNSKKIPGPRKFILCSNQPNQPPAHAKFCRPRKPRNQPIGLEPAQSGHTVHIIYFRKS